MVDTWKNCIFSQFLEFLNFGRFWPLSTQFWVGNARVEFVTLYKFSNWCLTFLTQNWVKSSQNQVKFKNSENWEKMQFFHVSTIFVAQKLVVTAQIEKKWILPLLTIGSNSLVFSSLKKTLFSKNVKISFRRIASKTGWKVGFGNPH